MPTAGEALSIYTNIAQANSDMYITAKEQTSMTTPPDGFSRLYPKSDERWYKKNDGGFETCIEDWTNVRDFSKGDGTTDDTASLLDGLNNQGDYKTFYFPDGDYLISDTLLITSRPSIVMSNKARIFTNTNLDYLIEYNTDKTSNSSSVKAIGKHWYGGILDGNDKCNNIIAFGSLIDYYLWHTSIYNFKQKGIVTSKVPVEYDPITGAVLSVGEITVEKCSIRNWNTAYSGSIGIYDNGLDNKFNNNSIINAQIAIDTREGLFNTNHAWISFAALYENSVYANVRSDGAKFIMPKVDTMRKAFVTTGFTIVYGMNLVNNNTILTPEIAAATPPQIFGGTGYYDVSGSGAWYTNGTAVVRDHYDSRDKFRGCSFGGTTSPDFTNYFDAENLNHTYNKGTLNNLDLNNYKTNNGIYKVGDISTALNLPISESGILNVIVSGNKNATGTQLIKQIYYPKTSTSRIFNRSYDASTTTWSTWDSNDEVLNKATINDPDFNDFKTQNGFYKVGSVVSALNMPTGAVESGILQVIVAGNKASPSTFLVNQTFYPFSTPDNFYTRRYTTATTTWSAWSKYTGATP